MGGVPALARSPDDPGSNLDDPELPARIRAGDRDAIQTVVESYLAQILRAARAAALDPQRAEDVNQATFATFIEAAPRFEGRSHVSTWLFGILYKKAAKARRKLDRDREIDEVVERRFDRTRRWIRPPRPADADLYDQEI